MTFLLDTGSPKPYIPWKYPTSSNSFMFDSAKSSTFRITSKQDSITYGKGYVEG